MNRFELALRNISKKMKHRNPEPDPRKFLKDRLVQKPDKKDEEKPVFGQTPVEVNLIDVKPDTITYKTYFKLPSITYNEQIIKEEEYDINSKFNTEKLDTKTFLVPVIRKTKVQYVKVAIRNNVRSMSEILKTIKLIYKVLCNNFRYTDKNILKIILSIWLTKGSLLLWGIPGTGKTTLTECMTYLLCNDMDFSTFKYKLDTIDTFVKSEFGNLGMATYTPSKLPGEIFYNTDIYIRKVQKRKNPLISETMLESDISAAEMKEIGYEVYDMKASARRIIKNPIKFHNEFNRASSTVQDALLRILEEGEIEEKGIIFKSPESINIFDGNRYLMMERNEIPDQALLDRIDVSVNVPNMDAWLRGELLEMQYTYNIASVRANVINDILSLNIQPLNYAELIEVWTFFSNIRLSTYSVDLINIILSFFSEGYQYLSFGIYEKYLLGSSAGAIGVQGINITIPIEMTRKKVSWVYGTKELIRRKRLNHGDITYANSSLSQFIPPEFVGNIDNPSPEKFIIELRKQVGHRAYNSMCRCVRAYTLLNNLLNEDGLFTMNNNKFVVVDFTNLNVPPLNIPSNNITTLLKYVISHRVPSDKVDEDIRSNFPNIEDIIDYIIVPRLMDQSIINTWKTMLETMYTILNDDKIVDIPKAMGIYDNRITDILYSKNCTNYENSLLIYNAVYIIREQLLHRFKMSRNLN